MRNRKLVTLALSATALGASLVAAPVASADTASTLVTLTLTGGALSIDTANNDAVALESGALGAVTGALTGTFPATTVTDNRGTFLGWDVTALTDGDLRTASGVTPARAIDLGDTATGGPLVMSANEVSAAVGGLLPAGLVPGSGSVNPTAAVTLIDMPSAGNLLTGLTGGGSYTYTPSVSLTVPAGTAAGSYSTTVTQTVL